MLTRENLMCLCLAACIIAQAPLVIKYYSPRLLIVIDVSAEYQEFLGYQAINAKRCPLDIRN